MKKRFGKLTAVVALGLSAVLLATACGGEKGGAGDNSNESKSIRVFFSDTVKTDNEEVSKAVSKMSEEKIGVKVEMVFFGAGEYATKMPKLIATNEVMDIGWDSGDTFVSRARDGAYYDISKDLDAYPGLKKLFPDKFLAGVTIDGGIYGIPSLKEMANNWAVYIDKATLDRHPEIDVDAIKTIADIEPILAALKSEGRLGFRIGNKGEHKPFDMEEHYDVITGPFVISNDRSEKANSKKVVNYFETEEFANYVKLLRSWYQKGYISNDVLENGMETYTTTTTSNPAKQGVTYVCYSPLNEVGASRGSKIGEVIPIQITPAVLANPRGSVLCIYNKSENKQSSLKFLELWNTDQEMNTLIKYGIEGKHYNFVEEEGVKKIQKVEGATDAFINQNWKTGNMLLGLVEVGEPANKAEVFNKWNNDAEESAVLGFTPELGNFEAELSACNAVVSGKAAALLTGAVDPEDPEYGIEAVKKEMQSAGSAKVVTEIQKQYLTWLKEK